MQWPGRGLTKAVVLLALLSLGGCFAAYDAARSDRDRQPLHHKVASGETLYGISFRYGLDYREMAKWNGIGAPYTIYPGQHLRLKAPNQPPRRASSGTTAKADPEVIKVTPLPEPPMPKPVATPAPSVTTKTLPPTSTSKPVAKVNKPAQKPATVKRTPTTPPSQWLWPADGKVVSSFNANDVTRHGMSIAGQQGQPIRASADGQVVYSGNGLKGYGQLIIIKHSDEYLSAYGHNKSRLVEEGQQVSAGQTIAEMGLDEGQPRLHFEIRRNGKPVDPKNHLPSK
ncbi:MAG: lipoprotein NlpD/LppB [Lysobacteraceae bacterium]|nr:MAG: lipoprotein NlpD/LppB [Xanthomonadaceae bacterium]